MNKEEFEKHEQARYEVWYKMIEEFKKFNDYDKHKHLLPPFISQSYQDYLIKEKFLKSKIKEEQLKEKKKLELSKHD